MERKAKKQNTWYNMLWSEGHVTGYKNNMGQDNTKKTNHGNKHALKTLKQKSS